MDNEIRIFDAPRLSEKTSIRLGGTAIAEVRLLDRKGFDKLPGILSRLDGRLALLGEGSNILAADGKLPLVLVTQEQAFEPIVLGALSDAGETGPKEQYDAGERVLIKVDAATRLPSLLSKAASLGLAGLEGLTGIPGSVGGAVAMNAGSYGVAMADVLHSVEVFSPLLGLVELPAERFDFAYRSCRLRGHNGWFLVAAATFVLQKGRRDTIRAAMRETYGKKQSTQPVTAKSAGCVFKNPEGASAGKLMDDAGLRGLARGGMRFSQVHANFLVNEGFGTFDEAAELIELAIEKVRAHSGHELSLEVKLWT